MTAFIGLWGHLLAATLYGALSLWQLRQWTQDPAGRPLVTAFAAMSVWTIFLAYLGADHFLSGFAECARNLAFLAFMHGLLKGTDEAEKPRTARYVYAAVAAVIGLQIVVAGLLAEFRGNATATDMLLSTAYLLGMTVAAGGLVLVHNLYGQAAPEAQGRLRLPVIALAAIWVYDLHLYTVAHLTRDTPEELFAMRGVALAMIVPLFALALRRGPDGWRMRLSRSATFQSLSAVAILVYLIVMMSAHRAIELAGADWASVAQIAIICAMSLGAFVFLPSAKARAWLKVITAKHFFEHRYDYRREWLRFTRAIGTREAADDTPIETRAIRALSELCDSPGGLLLIPEDDALVPAAHWNWPGRQAGGPAGSLPAILAAQSFVLDFSRIVGGRAMRGETAICVPDWLSGIEGWAGVPLVHGGRLVALAILARPPLARALDWEDFDLLRTAGMQAAAQIAEARAHEALADAARFDEFNRRFAFVMHDLKNLVSQLSLVARNAERHADNPAFRADMVATLQDSVKKMNDLLARLSPGGRGDRPVVAPCRLPEHIHAVAEAKNRLHPVTCLPGPDIWTNADAGHLREAIGHLVQNGIDASPPGAPIRLSWRVEEDAVIVDIADKGAGMSPAFIRNNLFRPFTSTKQGGFGIGAYEARALIEAMGGRLTLVSREGRGSCFTITLPLADPASESPSATERLSA